MGAEQRSLGKPLQGVGKVLGLGLGKELVMVELEDKYKLITVAVVILRGKLYVHFYVFPLQFTFIKSDLLTIQLCLC